MLSLGNRDRCLYRVVATCAIVASVVRHSAILANILSLHGRLEELS